MLPCVTTAPARHGHNARTVRRFKEPACVGVLGTECRHDECGMSLRACGSNTRAVTHAHTRSLTYTRSLVHTHALSLSLSHTNHTLTTTHTTTQPHTHTQPHHHLLIRGHLSLQSDRIQAHRLGVGKVGVNSGGCRPIAQEEVRRPAPAPHKQCMSVDVVGEVAFA